MYRDYKWKFALIGVMCLFALWATVVKPVDLGLDLKGGTQLVYSLDLRQQDPDARENVIQDVIEGLQRRIDIQGNKEVRIVASGENHITVQIPTLSKTEEDRIRNILETSGILSFKILLEAEQQNAEQRVLRDLLEKKARGTYEVEREEYDVVKNDIEDPAKDPNKRAMSAEFNEFDYLLVRNLKEDMVVTGTHLDKVRPSVNLQGQNIVSFTTTSDGSRRMGRLTDFGKGKKMAIILDGSIVSAPTIQDVITSNGQITGNFSNEEVKDLIIVLKSGSLVAKPRFEFEDKVGALLGQEAKESGLRAMLLALILVVAFMIAYYRKAGIVADVGLAVNLLLLWGVMVIFNFTLTLPGFAGILLTVGMSVDANILIFERIREELKRGLSLRQAIEAGYERAFWTIFDANVTTLLTGAILYVIGTGPIKGFALALCIGIVTSMFSALFVTKVIFGWLVGTEKLTELNFAEAVGADRKIDFMGKKKTAMTVSLVLILGGFIVFSARGDDKLGIDFTGGTELRVSFRKDMAKDGLEKSLKDIRIDERSPFNEIEIQAIGGGAAGASQYLIRTRLPNEADSNSLHLLQDELESRYRSDLAPLGWGHPETGEVQKIVRLAPDDDAGSLLLFANLEFADAAMTDDKTVQLLEQRLKLETGLTATVQLAPVAGATRFRQSTITVADDALTQGRALEIAQQVQNSIDGLTRGDGVVVSAPFPLVSTIGPAVANVLRNKAILAIFASLIGIILYITFRFEFKFAIASILALVHDVLITLGFIALGGLIGLDLKINLPIIAAFLTIIGYSLNDTIVVFDRIRENSAKRKKGEAFLDVVNTSINQTLSRTILTSFTTFIAVAILWALSGVGVIEGLSMALMCGIVVGTYSSIFVASSVLTSKRKTVQTICLVVFAALIAIGLFFSYQNHGWLWDIMQTTAASAG